MLRLTASRRCCSYASQEAVLQCAGEFSRLLGGRGVEEKEAKKKQYSHDESHHRPCLPALVLSPHSASEVSGCLRLCNEKRIPVVPFGTGTGIEGGAVPTHGGVVLNLMEMREVTSVNEEDFDCSVQPGVTRKALNERLRHTGLFFPVDPGADASLCGMAATGASGTNAVRYGTMKHNVLAMQVVLADGSVVETRGRGRRARKTSAGLNVTELFVGSEGILGVITEATLRLHARPPALSSAVCAFPAISNAISAVVQIQQCSIPIARVEFLDDVQVSACNAFSHLSLPVQPHLFLEFHGSSEDEVHAQSTAVGEICAGWGGTSFAFSTEEEERNRLWRARHDAYYAALALTPGKRGLSTDVCVPMSRLAEVVEETRRDLDEHGLIGTIVGHVGDGNFHVIIGCNEDDEEEMDAIWAFSDRIVRRALAAGGTCTGEHGIGIGKMKYLVEEVGVPALSVMQTVKNGLDPNGIMNPGKVL